MFFFPQEEVVFHKHEVVSINFTFNIVSFMLPKPPHSLSAEAGESNPAIHWCCLDYRHLFIFQIHNCSTR